MAEDGVVLQMSWQLSLLNLKRKNGSSPLGLRNLGNSCYLNSVLQCLTYTPPLANFCLKFQHSSSCDSATQLDRKRDCPFCILEKQIVRLLTVDLSLDAPSKIFSCLRIFSENFKCGRQEDAHEFLRYVIDACHNTCLRLKKLQQQRIRKVTNGVRGESFGGDTIVKEIFGGALQSQLKCLSCGNESNKIDEIMDICLEISGCSSLKDAMRNFFQAEILDGNNKYKCERCKKLVTAKKQMSILQAPSVLVVQLKRFEGIFGGKIDRVIAFEEILVLSSFMCKASEDLQPEYNLFATIVHSGFSPESGHYYAYIKDAMGHWYCCNDSYVTLSSLQEVLSEKAYILFFTRTSQRPVAADVYNGVKFHESNGRTPAVSNGVKCHESNGRTPTVSNGVKYHESNGRTPTVSNGVKYHESNGRTPTVSNGVKYHESNGKSVTVSNEVYSHENNGNLSMNPKSILPPKPVNMTSSNEPSFGKSIPVACKVSDSSVLQNKFSGLANSFAKKKSPSSNGKGNVQKKEPVGSNGTSTHIGHTQLNGFNVSSLAKGSGRCANGKQIACGRGQVLVNGNGQNGAVGSVKESIHQDNALRDEETGRKLPQNGAINNGPSNGHIDISGSKRKLEDRDTCILLAKDAQSQARVEEFKKVLQKEASLDLQSCGWSDEVYKFMRSEKRLFMGTCTSTDTNEQKEVLIADAKTAFISKIPGSLKGSLIERIQSFSRGE